MLGLAGPVVLAALLCLTCQDEPDDQGPGPDPAINSQEASRTEKNSSSVKGGAQVYRRIDFEDDLGGFRPARRATVERTSDAVSGQALLCRPRERWAGTELRIQIAGSRDLKIAFLAKGRDFPKASLNVFDRLANDNTTSYAPRFLPDDEWIPIVYYLDAFRYNSRREGTVDAATDYSSVRFFGPSPTARTQLILDHFVIYRGTDTLPPARVEDLAAKATARGIELSWDPAIDNVGSMGYVVSRRRAGEGRFTKVAEVHVPRWLDEDPGRGTIEYRVLALDFERNLGFWSETLGVESTVGHRARETEELATASYASSLREVHRRGVGRVRKGHVCFFGDSLTHAKVYREHGQAALALFTAAAYGFPRKRTDFGREQVHEILDRENPEFLLVLFGTNNLRNRQVPTEASLEKWMSDLEAIAHAAHSRGTVVLFGSLPPRGLDDPESKPEAVYNVALHKLGRRIQVPVAGIFEEFKTAGNRRLYLSGDGAHWTSAGMELAARAWAKAMDQVEWVLRDRPD